VAITIVNTTSSTASGAVTIPSTTALNSLVVAIGQNTTTFMSALVLGASNLAAAIQGTGTTCSSEVWWLDGIPGGVTSITLTPGASPSHFSAVIFEVSGIGGPGGSKDKSNTHGVSSSTFVSWSSNSSGTLSSSSELCVGAMGFAGVPSGQTGPGGSWSDTSPTNWMMAGTNIVSATTAQTFSGTATCSGTGNSSTSIATFKAGSNVLAIPNKANQLNQAVNRSAVW
jgi:hypothetical protein